MSEFKLTLDRDAARWLGRVKHLIRAQEPVNYANGKNETEAEYWVDKLAQLPEPSSIQKTEDVIKAAIIHKCKLAELNAWQNSNENTIWKKDRHYFAKFAHPHEPSNSVAGFDDFLRPSDITVKAVKPRHRARPRQQKKSQHG